MLRRVITTMLALSFAVGLAACGDTWRGAKQDTGENLEKTGQTIEKTGERVKN